VAPVIVFELSPKNPLEQTGALVDITGVEGAIATTTKTESMIEPQEVVAVK
jgi:hypothetical protein